MATLAFQIMQQYLVAFRVCDLAGDFVQSVCCSSIINIEVNFVTLCMILKRDRNNLNLRNLYFTQQTNY